MIPTYTVVNRHQGPWRLYRKTFSTPMARVKGAFCVQTKEGLLTCQDGWLAIDAAGYPYPISAQDHEQMYEEA